MAWLGKNILIRLSRKQLTQKQGLTPRGRVPPRFANFSVCGETQRRGLAKEIVLRSSIRIRWKKRGHTEHIAINNYKLFVQLDDATVVPHNQAVNELAKVGQRYSTWRDSYPIQNW
jgi:hypothetical protein